MISIEVLTAIVFGALAAGATWMHGLGRHVNNLDERIEHLEKDSRALKEANDELVGRLDALLEYLQERAAR